MSNLTAHHDDTTGRELVDGNDQRVASGVQRQRIGDLAEKLLGYCESNQTFQSDRLMTVPASVYTDPDHLRAEIDLIYKRLPLMLALSCEIPNAGDYKAMEVVGVPVLIVRDKSGIVRAFLNVCAHRWAPVAAEGRGTCYRFVCPFHGWSYGPDGKLLTISDHSKFGDIDRSTHGLKKLPCEERCGMIFVGLTQGIPWNLTDYFGALLDDYEGFALEKWTFLGSSSLDGPNWKLILTNFFESYHFATLHPRTGRNQVSNVNHYEGFGPNMRIGFAQRPITKLREVPREHWSEQEGRCFTFMRFLFPSVVASIAVIDSEIAVFNQLFPGETPDRTRLVSLMLRKEPIKDESDRERVDKQIRLSNEPGKDPVRDEDFPTGFATQKGLRSGAYDGLLYGRNERGPQYFHEWVDWYLKGDTHLPKPAL